MSKYFYNGIDIANIVSSGVGYGSGATATNGFNTDNTQGYNAFPGEKITPLESEIINITGYSYLGSSIFNNRIAQYYEYNNNGAFNIPFNGVNRLIVCIVGSGGGGGNNTPLRSGGRGGPPWCCLFNLNVTASVHNIAIGGGGRQSNGATIGRGGQTTFNMLNTNITVNGGNGGNPPGANNNGANGSTGGDSGGASRYGDSGHNMDNIKNILKMNTTNCPQNNNIAHGGWPIAGRFGVNGYVRVYYLFD